MAEKVIAEVETLSAKIYRIQKPLLGAADKVRQAKIRSETVVDPRQDIMRSPVVKFQQLLEPRITQLLGLAGKSIILYTQCGSPSYTDTGLVAVQ